MDGTFIGEVASFCEVVRSFARTRARPVGVQARISSEPELSPEEDSSSWRSKWQLIQPETKNPKWSRVCFRYLSFQLAFKTKVPKRDC